jgi:Ricin-type beta-trefoil lectin domain
MDRYCLSASLAVILAVCTPGHAAQLVGGASSSCVNLPEHGGSAEDGTVVRLFHCHDTSNQAWTVNNGHINSSFGACLDVQGSQPVDGAQIIIVTCNGRPSQKWSISNGQIIGIGGKCLDVLGSGTADTTPLILAPCSASPSQQWSVQ